jgi:uncharacterized protein
MRKPPQWARSPERARLLALYADVDTVLSGWACACTNEGVRMLERTERTDSYAEGVGGAGSTARCCHFGLTGREPYPTAVELEEVRHAVRAAGITLRSEPPKRDRRALPMADLRTCPLLSDEGRCRIYASRPFGCRTFFCDQAEGPHGARRRLPRDEVAAIGRLIAELSARFDPRDPRPRPLVRALQSGADHTA